MEQVKRESYLPERKMYCAGQADYSNKELQLDIDRDFLMDGISNRFKVIPDNLQFQDVNMNNYHSIMNLTVRQQVPLGQYRTQPQPSYLNFSFNRLFMALREEAMELPVDQNFLSHPLSSKK